jgi:hypothetical protein
MGIIEREFMDQVKEQAYKIEIDEVNGKFIITGNMGIAGPMANQLKHTSNKRKGASILRKLGHDIAEAGDILYGNKNAEVSNS